MKVKLLAIASVLLIVAAFFFVAGKQANVTAAEALTSTTTDNATVELLAYDSYSRFYRVTDHGVVCYAVANSSSSYGGQAISCVGVKGK